MVFADVPAATNALRGMQGFNFYDRPLVRVARRFAPHALAACADAAVQRLAFAHGKSDVVAKADGSWLPPDKRAKAVHGAGAFAVH